MTSLLDAPPAGKLRGSQLPRILTAPPVVTSAAGQEAVELAAGAGLVLDPWEAYVLEQALGERADGTWAAFEVGLIVGRQNGKGAILEARELAGLFLFKEQLILHSAHEFKTAQEAFLRIKGLIDNVDAYRRRVRTIRTSHGEEGIELTSGQRLRFVARSRTSGRGFSGDTVILDEAFELPESALSALLPTMSARPNPQIWYTSSAADQETHQNCHVLARLRRRGVAGTSPRLAFMEWSVDETDLDELQRISLRRDSQAWAESNPGLGIRINEEFIESELGAMSPKSFDVERLGIGDWPSEEGEDGPIRRSDWDECAIVPPEPSPPRPVFFLDASPMLMSASVGVAAMHDGKPHLELAAHRGGADWLAGRAAELKERHPQATFAVLGTGAVTALLPALQERGIEPESFTNQDMGRACAHLQKLVVQRAVTHNGDPVFGQALRVAVGRDIGDDLWTWSRRKSGDISPLVAVTGAAWLLESQLTIPRSRVW